MEIKWIRVLERKFGSLEAPDYSFVLDEVEKKPYQQMMDEMCKKFVLKEDTDENYDVSFGYVLSFSLGNDFLFRISMIAPFAFLARMHLDGSTSKPIVREFTHDEAELELINVIESHGVSLLDAKTLDFLVPQAKKYSKPLYQWLFVDEEKAPWS
ncbi:hypothetical protein [Variovorax sp. CF313]|uniref:hypothetical protein n=1 Tax=Variovorax sp. CF313 TaxID=1144315 RepID=UPI0012F7C8F4|nr:hypothetical protein [Variovorax sp. CF313]